METQEQFGVPVLTVQHFFKAFKCHLSSLSQAGNTSIMPLQPRGDVTWAIWVWKRDSPWPSFPEEDATQMKPSKHHSPSPSAWLKALTLTPIDQPWHIELTEFCFSILWRKIRIDQHHQPSSQKYSIEYKWEHPRLLSQILLNLFFVLVPDDSCGAGRNPAAKY